MPKVKLTIPRKRKPPPGVPAPKGGSLLVGLTVIVVTVKPFANEVQRRRPPPVAETGRSCWGRGQQDASSSEADAGSRNPALASEARLRGCTKGSLSSWHLLYLFGETCGIMGLRFTPRISRERRWTRWPIFSHFWYLSEQM